MTTRASWKMVILSITAVLSVIVLSGSARASVLAYEGFRLSFPQYANGGTGFTNAWSGFGFTTRAKSLCLTKKPGTSVGGSVAAEPSGFIFRTLTTPLGTDGTTVYISFLVQPQDDVTGFFGLSLSALFIGRPGGGAINDYVIETVGGTGQIDSGAPVVVGQTTLLVVKIQFQTGADVVTLFVDPTPGRPEPGPQFVKTDLDLGTGNFSIEIRAGAGTQVYDEIRVGTTFADVVPSGDKQPDPDFLGCL